MLSWCVGAQAGIHTNIRMPDLSSLGRQKAARKETQEQTSSSPPPHSVGSAVSAPDVSSVSTIEP